MTADAFSIGLGDVLMQVQDGSRRPVCYASRSLTEAEKRYAVIEKEALAPFWLVENSMITFMTLNSYWKRSINHWSLY